MERALRTIGLEPLIYYYVYAKDHARFREHDLTFIEAHPHLVLPPPRLRFDVIACSSAEYYVRTGREMAAQMESVIRRWLPERHPVICEWGCGPGRILMELARNDPGQTRRFIGTDAYAPSIRWAQSVSTHRLTFMLNQMEPPLALPAGSVDFTYAVSVFTHLSEPLTRSWFAEIIRILKPGGLFWFSTHGGTHHEAQLDATRRAALARGEFVAIPSWHNGSQMYTGIHCPALMRSIIAETGAELIEYLPDGNQNYQDAWIVRKSP